MTTVVIDAREKFLRRQIERAYEIAKHYRDVLNDPTSAVWVEDWAAHAEFELEQLIEHRREMLEEEED
jgi:hypothetical protein